MKDLLIFKLKAKLKMKKHQDLEIQLYYHLNGVKLLFKFIYLNNPLKLNNFMRKMLKLIYKILI